jgi:hypothetical protein
MDKNRITSASVNLMGEMMGFDLTGAGRDAGLVLSAVTTGRTSIDQEIDCSLGTSGQS